MAGLVKDWREGEAGRDPEEWLENAPEFSRPLVRAVREWILDWEPDLAECIKWSALCFQGRKLVCALGAFKKHAGITFFRGSELDDPAGLFNQGEGNVAMQTIRLTTLDSLDREAFRRLLRAAVRLDDEPPMPRPRNPKRPPLEMPAIFATALQNDAQAAAGFARFPPSAQREYIAWLIQAKRPETLASRLQQTLRAIAQGHRWADRKKH